MQFWILIIALSENQRLDTACQSYQDIFWLASNEHSKSYRMKHLDYPPAMRTES